ncbi:dihydroxyacetone kinase subunit DhaK [Streptomyces olivaceus]
MQKLINTPAGFAADVVDAILALHPDQLSRVGDTLGVVRAESREDRVAVVTGGGSGHLPLFLGYVGDGLLAGAAVGDVFQSPSAAQIAALVRQTGTRAGALFLYGNYGGDVLNFQLAEKLLGAELPARSVVVGDDVMSSKDRERRRGIAGMCLLFKIAGAAADRGDTIDEVQAVVERAARHLGTSGVALSPAVLPSRGEPTFELPDGEMEIGMGIHGEPGVDRRPLATADEVGRTLASSVLDDGVVRPEYALLVNGLGATPKEELYLVARAAQRTVTGRGARVWRTYVGEFATSLEMGGASVTLLAVDDELKDLLGAPAAAPLLDLWGAK